MQKIIFFSGAFILLVGCQTIKYKDVIYGESKNNPALKLNIFVPKTPARTTLPVLMYVHGGNWNSGNKDMYSFFGRNFAKRDIITVIPQYTLSPTANVAEMTAEIATALKWVQQNIEKYHGDANNIFVTGHSAGAQLVTSAVLNPEFNIVPGSVAGIILNDAAGIDMKNYLTKYPPTQKDNYLATWSSNPENWYQASPIYFLSEDSPPFFIYIGSKTYESIKVANKNFMEQLKKFQPNVQPVILDKGHIPMILQYYWPWSKRFNETVEFIGQKQK